MSDKYAGACWNALMEEETKESIAELYMDSIRELHALTAENARLKAPVSDEKQEEICKLLGRAETNGDSHMLTAIRIINLIARASTPPDANTSWFCVPCGFTTRDAAEAQAHLGPHMIELTCPFDEQIWRFHTQAQADMLQKHLDHHAAQLSTTTPEAR